MRDGRLLKYDVLSSDLGDSGEIRIQVGDRATTTGVASNCAWWGSDGFVSRPNDADSDGACMVLVHEDGNTRRVIASKDNRFVDGYKQLNPGDRAIITNGPASVFVKKSDDSVTLKTETSAGDLAMVQLGTDTITLMMPGSGGTAMVQVKSGEVTIGCGGSASIVLKGGNVTVHGDLFFAATGRGVLGGLLGTAPPIGAQSILAGPQGQVGVPSSSWTVTPRKMLAATEAWLMWLVTVLVGAPPRLAEA